MALSADGKRVASAGPVRAGWQEQKNAKQWVDGPGGVLKVWDGDTGDVLLALDGIKQMVTGVALSADGKRVAAGSRDTGQQRELKVWEVNSGREVFGRAADVTMPWGDVAVALSADGRRCAATLGVTGVKVWDVDDGLEFLARKASAFGVALSADGKRVALTAGDARRLERDARVWDVEAGAELLSVTAPFTAGSDMMSGTHPDWWGAWIYSLRGDGAGIAWTGGGKVRLWDVDVHQELLSVQLPPHEWRGRTAMSDDGKRLTTLLGGKDGADVTFWDAETGRELRPFRLPKFAGRNTKLSAGGSRFATATHEGKVVEKKVLLSGEVRVWDAETGKEVFAYQTSTAGVFDVSLSADGRRLASAGTSGEVKVRDVDAGQELFSFAGYFGSGPAVALSADGRRVAAWGMAKAGTGVPSRREVKVWEVDSGKEVLSVEANELFGMNRDGTRIALGKTGSGRGVEWSVLDVDTSAVISSLNAFRGSVQAVALSPDGRRLVGGVGKQDEAAKLVFWDVGTGQELLSFPTGGTGVISHVAFSADGRRVLADCAGGVVKVWDAP